MQVIGLHSLPLGVVPPMAVVLTRSSAMSPPVSDRQLATEAVMSFFELELSGWSYAVLMV